MQRIDGAAPAASEATDSYGKGKKTGKGACAWKMIISPPKHTESPKYRVIHAQIQQK